MKLKNLLACTLLGTTICIQAKDKRPNVIIIYADDLGYGDIGCYGSDLAKTPNIDKLATQGTRFVNAHSAAATSTPSRFSLLTGEYAFRQEGTDVANGDAAMIIHDDCYTMADMFKSAGYATAAIGKWHLGLGHESGKQDWNKPLEGTPADLGFDYTYIMAATADRVPCVFIENGMVANHDPSHPITVNYYEKPEGATDYKANPELAYKQKSSHGHDMSVINGIGRIGYMKGGGKALWRDEDIADSIVAHATRFITDNRDNPFFIYLATNDIHVPRMPHERFRGQSPMGLRGEAIMQLDWTVGKIMETISKEDLVNETIVIISSDNGPIIDDGYQDHAEEMLGSHRPWGEMRGTKYSIFEAGTRIPLIISWPSVVNKDCTSEALVSQVDLFKSLASIIGCQMPQGAAPDSFDESKALFGNDNKGREWIVEQGYALALRTRQWKYIAPSNYPSRIQWGADVETGCDTAPQLYDIRDEHRNVADEHPEVVKEMDRMLKSIINSCGQQCKGDQ